MKDPMPTRCLTWLRLGLVTLFVASASAEWATRGALPQLRNTLADLGLVAVLLSASFLRDRSGDLQLRRRRSLAVALPAGIAILAAYRTLRLPYLSDDWFLLAILRKCPSPFHAFGTPLADLYFRPVGWFIWWFFARLSPLDGTLAHAVCVALFVIDAALVVPALRRCGAPRGIAVAAAACFAASPAVSGTVAWAANLYVILSVGFSLATIAWLPIRRATAASTARTFILAALAFLSKEDSFLLPVLLAAAGARFRWRHVSRGLRLATPAAAALTCALALRWICLGGIGGYSDLVTGQSLVIDHYLAGAIQTAKEEFPTVYFQPLFTWGGPSLVKSLVGLVPLALLGFGGASPEARRGVPRALAIVLVGLAPVVWTLPVGPSVVNARQLFMPSIGVAWIAAALIAGLPLARSVRVGALALYVAASLIIGNRNFWAWEEADRLFRSGSSAAGRIVATAPPASTVLAYGLPEMVHGAPCFLNVTHEAIPRMAGRPDVEVVPTVAKRVDFDFMIEVDAEAGIARDVTRSEVEARLASGETLRFDFTTTAGRERCRSFGWGASPAAGPWDLFARGQHSSLRLPVLGVAPGEKLLIRLDASAAIQDQPVVPTVVVTYEVSNRFVRQPVALGQPFRLSPSARTLRVEITAPIGTEMRLRGLTIEAP